MQRLPSNIIIILIKMYQHTLSKVFPATCKFSPSCSQYMIDAINSYGLIKVSIGYIPILVQSFF